MVFLLDGHSAIYTETAKPLKNETCFSFSITSVISANGCITSTNLPSILTGDAIGNFKGGPGGATAPPGEK